ncbi:MAG: LCP family protein, partial [Lachnospira sp.]|nr:LCP family protein [Lachnospira sp.]
NKGKKKDNIIFLSESNYEMICDEHKEFKRGTKIIHTVSIETAITIERNSDTSTDSITDKPFIAYLSGNDTTGSITDTGRSDVNILAVVNPKTKHILLVSTPRDYFITIYNQDGKSGTDKLTHAGNYGTGASIQALENLYKTEIDYYCKVNFTGCIDIIDALGGITINSEVDFTTSGENVANKHHFIKGKNYCDGAKALAFVRERNAFADGDFQRGRNQQAAISAIIDKATSAAILANYASVLNAVSKMVATNMPTSAMSDLIRAQIANPTPWTIDTYGVTALDMDVKKDCTLSGLKNVNVVIPDYNSVNEAIKLINSTLNE